MFWRKTSIILHEVSPAVRRFRFVCLFVCFCIVSNYPNLITIQMCMFRGLTFLIVWYIVYVITYLDLFHGSGVVYVTAIY